jgi:hypothetical protein
MGLLNSLFRAGSARPNEDHGNWLRPYADVLGGRFRQPEHHDEHGFIDGATDAISWTLRILARKEPDSDSHRAYHHLLWHTDSVRVDEIVVAFGNSSSHVGLWDGRDGMRGGPTVTFVERARPLALPSTLSAPWHGLALDPAAGLRLFTPDVLARLDECEAIQDPVGGWMRVWIGGPNVRFEASAVDPAPDSYRHLVDAGVAIARTVSSVMDR